MNDNANKRRLACVALVLFALYGCGGGGSETPTDSPAPDPSPVAPPPLNPVPALTYRADANVCLWMAEHIKPFVWPSQSWGPRTWPPAQIATVQTPLRNDQGMIRYQVSSSTLVVHAHYGPQIEAKGLTYTSGDLWAQEASCKHSIDIDSRYFGASTAYWFAYMADSTATRVSVEEYTATIAQVSTPDPCKPGPVFPGAPVPPECKTPPQ